MLTSLAGFPSFTVAVAMKEKPFFSLETESTVTSASQEYFYFH